MPKSLICGDEDFKTGIDGGSEENAISKPQPLLRADRRGIVIFQFRREGDR